MCLDGSILSFKYFKMGKIIFEKAKKKLLCHSNFLHLTYNNIQEAFRLKKKRSSIRYI